MFIFPPLDVDSKAMMGKLVEMKKKWEADHPGQPFVGSLMETASGQMEKMKEKLISMDKSGKLGGMLNCMCSQFSVL